jgi:hypothetical protein
MVDYGGGRLGGLIMTTYRKAFDVLRDAVNNPDDPQKLQEVKQHPRLEKTFAGFTLDDMKVLSKVAKAAPGQMAFKCDDGN